MWQYFPISPLVIPLLCLQLINTSILWRISFSRFFLIIYLFCGMGIAGREGYWANCLPHVFHVSFLFSVCIRFESILLQLFLMMLSVCFYIRHIPNLYCYHDHIGVSYDFFVVVVQIFHFRSSPVPDFFLIFVAIESCHWSFVEFQRTVKWCENLKLLISDLLGYPRPARQKSNGPRDLDIWPIHTSSHANDHLVSNREIIHQSSIWCRAYTARCVTS